VIESEETLEDIKLKQKPPKPADEVEEEKPQEFVFKLNDVHVKKHEEAIFEVKLPKRSDVKWLKDGKHISPDSKYALEVLYK
jgi:hypothetical protein